MSAHLNAPTSCDLHRNPGGPAPSTHRVSTGGGGHCQLFEWRTAGQPVLLVHGTGSNAGTWFHFARALDPRFRPLAIDLRGHGESSWSDDYRLDAFVRDLEAVRDWIREPFAIVGHSLGAEAALHFAARNPLCTRALVLVDVGARLSPPGRAQIRSDLARTLRTYGSRDEYLRDLRKSYLLAEDGRLRELAERALRPMPSGRYELALDPAILQRFDPDAPTDSRLPPFWAALAAVTRPALLVRGASSGVLRREHAERIVDALPFGELSEISRAGHAVMLDRSEAFAAAVLRFLRKRLGPDT